MEDVWEINDLKVRFKRKLELFFEKYWKSKIDAAEIGNKGNSKLRCYKMFKNKFSKEEYLSLPIKFKHRQILTKFRCSDHNLMIETGRHKQLKIEERICKYAIYEKLKMKYISF